LKTFKRAMLASRGHSFKSKEKAQAGFDETVFDKLCVELEPKAGTIEALILPEGSFLLLDALYETACILFPDEEVYMSEGDGEEEPARVLILGDLVFDIIGFFMWTRDADPEYDPNELYIDELDCSKDESESSYITQEEFSDPISCSCSECAGYYDDLGTAMEFADDI
jgi:hypothetical protein